MQQDHSARCCNLIKRVDLGHIKSPENVVKMLVKTLNVKPASKKILFIVVIWNVYICSLASTTQNPVGALNLGFCDAKTVSFTHAGQVRPVLQVIWRDLHL